MLIEFSTDVWSAKVTIQITAENHFGECCYRTVLLGFFLSPVQKTEPYTSLIFALQFINNLKHLVITEAWL